MQGSGEELLKQSPGLSEKEESSMQISLPRGYPVPALPARFTLALLFAQDIIIVKACARISLFFCALILLRP